MNIEEALKWVDDYKLPAQVVEQVLAKAYREAQARINHLEASWNGQNKVMDELIAKISDLESILAKKDEALNIALDHVGLISSGDTWTARKRIEEALALRPKGDKP